MADGPYAVGVVHGDSATQEERDVAVVDVKKGPVEMLSVAACLAALGVEKQHVGVALILAPSLHVLLAADAERFYDFQSRTDVGVYGTAKIPDFVIASPKSPRQRV